MKTLLCACLAGILAGSPLRAQETPAAPDDARPQSVQPTPATLNQQVLRLTTQAMSAAEQRPAATPDAAPKGSEDDQIMQNPLVKQLLRLMVQTMTNLEAQTAPDAATDAKAATAVLSEALNPPAAPPAPEHPGGSLATALVQAWDSHSPSPGGLHTGSLQIGSLHTGTLQTGTLHTGSLQTSDLQSGSASPAHPKTEARTTSAPPPSEAVAAALPTHETIAPVAATNAPPVDPDDAMRRWSQRVDGQFASEQAARNAAVKQYPQLAVANSAFNTQFLARYSQYRQADPFGILRGPGWPMKLAIFTDNDLKRQASGMALAP